MEQFGFEATISNFLRLNLLVYALSGSHLYHLKNINVYIV